MSILKTKTSLKIDCLAENTFWLPTEISTRATQSNVELAGQRVILLTGQSKKDTQTFSGYATE
jgi:hypothetical protein